MGTRKYKIHVKRLKSQRIKKCRGFKRLIFKSVLICNPKNVSEEYSELSKWYKLNRLNGVSKEFSKKKSEIYSEILENKIYNIVIEKLITKNIFIKYQKIVGTNHSYKVNIYDKYNNQISVLISNEKIKFVYEDYEFLKYTNNIDELKIIGRLTNDKKLFWIRNV